MKIYVTFGQVHRHEVEGKIFDRDCVAVIDADDYWAGRKLAFEYFGPKFAFCYAEDEWLPSKINLFPRGYVEL